MSKEYRAEDFYEACKNLPDKELAVIETSEEIKMVTDVSNVALTNKCLVVLGFANGDRAGAQLTKEELQGVKNVTELILFSKDKMVKDGIKDF